MTEAMAGLGLTWGPPPRPPPVASPAICEAGIPPRQPHSIVTHQNILHVFTLISYDPLMVSVHKT